MLLCLWYNSASRPPAKSPVKMTSWNHASISWSCSASSDNLTKSRLSRSNFLMDFAGLRSYCCGVLYCHRERNRRRYEICRITATDFFIFRIDFYLNKCYHKDTGTVPFRVLENMRSIEGQSILRYFYLRTGDSFRLAHGKEYPIGIVKHSLYTSVCYELVW